MDFSRPPPGYLPGSSPANSYAVQNRGPPTGPPPSMQVAPIHTLPPLHQRPLPNQVSSINQSSVPPVNQSSPIYQRSLPTQGPSKSHSSPMTRRPPINQSTPVYQGSPVYQGPQQSPVYQEPQRTQGAPVYQGPPINQPPPSINQVPATNQKQQVMYPGGSVVQGPPPPTNQGPAMDQPPPGTTVNDRAGYCYGSGVRADLPRPSSGESLIAHRSSPVFIPQDTPAFPLPPPEMGSPRFFVPSDAVYSLTLASQRGARQFSGQQPGKYRPARYQGEHGPGYPNRGAFNNRLNRKRIMANEQDGKSLRKSPSKKKKPLSQNMPSKKDWTLEEAQRALDVERELNKLHKSPSLIIKFPDAELNRDIVQQFHPLIESVHFQQPSTARFCFVTLKDASSMERVIKELSKIPFGNGYLSAEPKNNKEEDQVKGPEDIDPMTLYVGNLSQEVTVDDVLKAYPDNKRIDIGFAKKMKYTRYAFVSFRTVDAAIAAFRRTHGTDMRSKSLIVRFRRLHGTVGLPGDTKVPSKPAKKPEVPSPQCEVKQEMLDSFFIELQDPSPKDESGNVCPLRIGGEDNNDDPDSFLGGNSKDEEEFLQEKINHDFNQEEPHDVIFREINHDFNQEEPYDVVNREINYDFNREESHDVIKRGEPHVVINHNFNREELHDVVNREANHDFNRGEPHNVINREINHDFNREEPHDAFNREINHDFNQEEAHDDAFNRELNHNFNPEEPHDDVFNQEIINHLHREFKQEIIEDFEPADLFN